MKSLLKPIALAVSMIGSSAMADPGAFLEITLSVAPEDRSAAAAVYAQFKQPFLTTIEGSVTKVLLVRDEDVQVLHGFETVEDATDYLSSELFQNDVFVGLKPYFEGDPDVRVYVAN